jgi:hypothetical protein
MNRARLMLLHRVQASGGDVKGPSIFGPAQRHSRPTPTQAVAATSRAAVPAERRRPLRRRTISMPAESPAG